ncbi:hypothetical protein WJ883_12135, partial [Coxiella burnetii]
CHSFPHDAQADPAWFSLLNTRNSPVPFSTADMTGLKRCFCVPGIKDTHKDFHTLSSLFTFD